MRLAASSTARCLLTDWRAISRCEHISPRVWPLRSFRLSSSRRRLGSASALNASSIEGYAAIWLHILGSRVAACQDARVASGRRLRVAGDGGRHGGGLAGPAPPRDRSGGGARAAALGRLARGDD